MALFKKDDLVVLKEKYAALSSEFSYYMSESTVEFFYTLFGNDLNKYYNLTRLFDNYDIDIDRHKDFIYTIYNKVNDFDVLYDFLRVYVKNRIIFNNTEDAESIFNLFQDKRIAVNVFEVLVNNDNLLENTDAEQIKLLLDYIAEARQYYVDEHALLASFTSLITTIDPSLVKYGDAKKIKKIIKEKVSQDKKICGIYTIDEFALKEVDRKLDELGLLAGKLSTLVDAANSQITILRNGLEENKSELNKAKIHELESLRAETLKMMKEFNEKYQELLLQEKQSLMSEKDVIISGINADIQERIVGLTALGDSVAKRVSAEIGRIRTASNDSIIQMQDFLSNNENIQQMVAQSGSNEELIKKLSKLDEITVAGAMPTTVVPGVITDMPSVFVPISEIDRTINYYFDENVPFAERFGRLMELKEKDIKKNNAIYHEKFDDVLKLILENKTPYMYGPSGCGKTFMIEGQIAKLLGLDVTTNGYVLYEQDILGYTNSGNGLYVPSNFYRCFKMGNIIFFDELDNGIANSTVVLNRFIGGNPGDPYVFPNGEMVERHPNFRIVSAGNTKGSGKTLTYNTRQKMDESVMQRVTPIEVNYDNRIEEVILRDYPGWFNFAVNFRKVLEKADNRTGEERNSVGTFTTRDAASVKRYLDHGSFDDEKILEYEIIENKEKEYIVKIQRGLEELEDKGEFTREGKEILHKFKKLVKAR